MIFDAPHPAAQQHARCPSIRPARETDAAAVVALIRLVLMVSNSVDYAPELLSRAAAGFTLDGVKRRIVSTLVLVAEIEDRLVGTGSLDGSFMRSLFVDPYFQRQGIGAALCDAIEGEATRRGLAAIDVQSSLTERPFYVRRSYHFVSETMRDDERIVMMRERFI